MTRSAAAASSPQGKGRALPLAQARLQLSQRLRTRRPEIEQLAFARVHGVAEPDEGADPEYLVGLRAAVSAAVDYGIQAVEEGERRTPATPPILLSQARMAARFGVSVDTVLRRYFAGYALLGDVMIEEAERSGLEATVLKRLLREAATVFDRLLAAVSDDYNRTAIARAHSDEQRRTMRIERLLAGELIDTSEFGYDFDAQHVGLVASGGCAVQALRDLATTLDRRLLLVRPDENIVWAWFGGRRRLSTETLAEHACGAWPATATVAIGEPGEGLTGWRLTHRQAGVAFPVASSQEAVVRYVDVALIASMLQDDVLATSLREIYLAPLEGTRDGGEAARDTLRAYFAAEGNISSSASALGVNRHTVKSRLRAIEERIGRSLSGCSAELHAALRLEAMTDPASVVNPRPRQ